MLKTWFFLISLLLISYKTYCQNTSIPDHNFEQALIDLGLDDPPIDNQVLTSNISGIKDLDVNSKNIQDLTGIEDFLALSSLDCTDNQLTVLNLTQNVNLTEIYCGNNQLSILNIDNLSNLLRLWCFSNQLQNINITQNPALVALRCENNSLSSLDLSMNINLIDLTCAENQLTSLNITNNLNLTWFECGNNLLSTLDVSNNTVLRRLECDNNLLSTLDLTTNTELNVLFCQTNQIRTLNLSQNSMLTRLDCSNNDLCQLIVNNGNNTNIASLNFKENTDLSCVVVDKPNGNHSIWEPTDFLNYANSNEGCSAFIPVDILDDFIGITYTLPSINDGNYFTEPEGHGILLNAGDLITTSQTIYIYNEINCYSNTSSFNVILTDSDYFIPKFFTPNHDGFNDVWTVFDNANVINNISIFNRNGKLLKFLSGSTLQWDGTYKGEPLHSGSYWYKIVFNSKEILRGYFALKR